MTPKKVSYNSSNIKRYKGKLIELTYVTRKSGVDYIKTVIGEITQTSRVHVLFDVNKEGEIELALKYHNLIKLKHFNRKKLA